MHTRSPNKPKQFKQTLSACLPARKLMETVFWNRKGMLTVEFMQKTHSSVKSAMRNTKRNSVGLFRTKGTEC
jgi:hypothetical protein